MRILYVEDNPSDADLAQRWLRKQAPQFALETVTTQSEAVARLTRTDASPYDLVLTDLRLPDGDGLSLLNYIRERALPLAVVVITGSGDEETAVAALKAGADDYVVKRNDYLERLPLTLESAWLRARAERQARPLKALYAEHHETDIDLTRRHLQRYAPHIHLDVAPTATEALARLSLLGEANRYDVILLDYRLPGLNALAALKELRQDRGPDIPVVLITGQGDEELALQALKLGAASYLVKNPGYLYQLPSELENACYRAEQRKAIEAITQRDQLLQTMFHSLSSEVVVVDREGTITYASKSWEQFASEGQAQMSRVAVGVNYLEVCRRAAAHDDASAKEALSGIEGVMAGRAPSFSLEYPCQIRGEMGWFLMQVDPMPREHGGVVISHTNITQRKRAEAALTENELRLREAQAIAHVGSFHWDVAANTVVWSDELCRIYGYEPGESRLTYETYLEQVHPDHREQVRRAVERALTRREMFEHEYRIVRPTGETRWVFAHGRPVVDAGGTLIALQGICQDITERKRTRESLRESEMRNQAMLRAIPDWMFLTSEDGVLLDYHAKDTRELIMPPDEFLGKNVRKVLPPEIAERLLHGFKQAVESGEPCLFEYSLPNHEGDRHYEARVASCDHDKVLSIVRDITERKQAETALRESEERFAKAFHSSPQPMSITTLDEGRYVDVNERFLEVSGYTRGEVIGRTSFDLNIWESPEARDEIVRPVKERGQVRNMETRFFTKSGEFRVLLSSVELIELGGQQCLLFASSDITERKRAEAANLRRATLFADVNAALAERDVPLQSILQQCAEAVTRHLDAAFARIWTLNHKESVLELQASAGLYTHLNGRHSRVGVGELKIGQIAEERQPLLTNDVCNDPRVNDREWAREQGMAAFAGYPLLVEDRVVGVMAMFARHQLTEDTVEALATVAAPIAQGIERKRAEQALGESEERFRSAFDHATIGMALIAPDGRFLQVNHSVCEMLGYSEQELLANDFQSLTHPDDLDANLAYRRQILAGEIRAFQMEKRYIHKRGHTVWALLSVSLLRDAGGQPLYFISQIQDITERKLAGEKLRESEERFRQLAENIGAAFFLTEEFSETSPGRVVYVSPAYEKIWGRSRESVYQNTRSWLDAVHSEDRERVLAALSSAGQKQFDEQFRIVRPDGEVRWVHDRVFPIRDESGAIYRLAGIVEDITERKQIEGALRESQLRYKLATAAGGAGVWDWNLETGEIYVAPTLKAVLGFEDHEIENRIDDWGRRVYPEDADRVMARAQAHIDGLTPHYEVEHRMLHKDGSVRCFLTRGTIVESENGHPRRMVGTDTDITERKRAGEALRESEERLRLALEAGRMGVWEWDAETDALKWSKEHYAVMGLEPFSVEPDYHTWADRVHPDDLPAARGAIKGAIKEQREYQCEYRIIWPDGSVRWLEGRGKPVYDNGGQCVKVGGLIVDITERKRAEEALRESEARARRALVEQMLAGVAECDATGMFKMVNQRFCDIAGYTEAELLERGTGDILHPDDLERVLGLKRRLIETGESFATEHRFLRKDGSEVWVNNHVSSVRNALGEIEKAVAVLIDITDRKRAEREREQLLKQEKTARAEAQAANRSKDEFLAVVSHELRSPLNAILGYTRLLRGGVADAADIQETVEIIERNGRMQLQLIEDLLDSARIISGKLKLEVEPVSLTNVITAALDVVRPAAKAKGIELRSDLEPLAGQITGDPKRLQQVLWNLLSNAIKFTPRSGRVELWMENVGQHIRITVKDTGKGIEAEFLPFVFDRFRQSDTSSARRFGGLGLGLSLVKQLVELHGGTIEAASDGSGCGATFTVTLPQHAAQTEAFTTEQPRAVALREMRMDDEIPLDQIPSLAGVRVLVVDDEEEARSLLTAVLGECEAQVMAVSSGIEALAILADPPGGKRPDALILDINMPDEDGYQVLERVRALEAERGVAPSARIPAIALTAMGRTEDRLKALAAGFRMHIVKPVEPTELAVVIASLVERLSFGRSV